MELCQNDSRIVESIKEAKATCAHTIWEAEMACSVAIQEAETACSTAIWEAETQGASQAKSFYRQHA